MPRTLSTTRLKSSAPSNDGRKLLATHPNVAIRNFLYMLMNFAMKAAHRNTLDTNEEAPQNHHVPLMGLTSTAGFLQHIVHRIGWKTEEPLLYLEPDLEIHMQVQGLGFRNFTFKVENCLLTLLHPVLLLTEATNTSITRYGYQSHI